MSKLSDVYTSVENQLQWGPGLAPFFKELISEIDALTAQVAALTPIKEAWASHLADEASYASLKTLTLADVEADPKIEELQSESAQDSKEVATLESEVNKPQTEQAQEAPTVAAAPGITGILESPSPSHEPAAAAPTSTSGVANE